MILIGIAFVFINGYSTYKLVVCILLVIYKAIEAFSEIFYGIMQKNQLLYVTGQSFTIKSLGGLVALLIVDIITKNLILAILSAITVSILTTILFDYIVVRKLVDKKEKVNFRNVLSIYKNEFFVFANTFAAVYILNAPKYSIDKFLEQDMQAMFGYIIMPASIMVLFTQFIFMPYLNRIKELYEQKDMGNFKKLAFKIKMFVLAFGVFAIGAAYFVGPEVLKLIYGVPELLNYRMNLCIILIAFVFYGMSYVNLVLLTTTRNTFIQFVIYIITMIIALVGSNILVKQYGIDGATYSCIITLITQFIMYTIVTKIILHKISIKNSSKVGG